MPYIVMYYRFLSNIDDHSCAVYGVLYDCIQCALVHYVAYVVSSMLYANNVRRILYGVQRALLIICSYRILMISDSYVRRTPFTATSIYVTYDVRCTMYVVHFTVYGARDVS